MQIDCLFYANANVSISKEIFLAHYSTIFIHLMTQEYKSRTKQKQASEEIKSKYISTVPFAAVDMYPFQIFIILTIIHV